MARSGFRGSIADPHQPVSGPLPHLLAEGDAGLVSSPIGRPFVAQFQDYSVARELVLSYN